LIRGLAAATDVDFFALVERKLNREMFTPLVMTIAKG
jgi:hypothetical protein